jgi:hypothetical protein
MHFNQASTYVLGWLSSLNFGFHYLIKHLKKNVTIVELSFQITPWSNGFLYVQDQDFFL